MINLDKLYNIEYEKNVLGSCLLDNSIIDDVASNLTKEMFSARNAVIFEAIVQEYNDSQLVEFTNLKTRLPKMDLTYLLTLTDGVMSSANAGFYIEEVKKLWQSRWFLKITSDAINVLSPTNGIDTVQSLESQLVGLMETGQGTAYTAQQLVSDFFDDLQKSMLITTPYLGYETGWENLNDILDGLRDGKVYTVGARPGMGKTSFALQLLTDLCKKKVPCCFFSYEMGRKELMLRIMSARSKISGKHISHGLITKSMDGLQKLQSVAEEIFEYPMTIYDDGLGTEKDLFSLIRVEAKKNGKKVFFIDHLGLVPCSDPTLPRYLQIKKLTSGLKQLARNLNVVIILLSQVKRDSEGKRPTLADLRESSSIEEDSDVIMFIHRNRTSDDDSQIPTEFIVEKNRDGSMGVAKMLFLPHYTKFVVDSNPEGHEIKEENKEFKVGTYQKKTEKVEQPALF